jgi:hypothetical protein
MGNALTDGFQDDTIDSPVFGSYLFHQVADAMRDGSQWEETKRKKKELVRNKTEINPRVNND